MSWVEKYRKINNRGRGGSDYSGLKSMSNQSFKVDGKNNTWNSLFDNGRLVYDYFLFL